MNNENTEISESYNQNRPHKVAIIGGGDIGKQILKLGKERGLADHFTLWNHGPIEMDSNEHAVQHKGSDPATGRRIAEDQANIIRNSPYRADGSIFPTQPPKGSPDSTAKFFTEFNDRTAARANRDRPYNQAFEAIEGADLVIVTAGVPRAPGQNRIDLLQPNIKLLAQLAPAIKANPNKQAIYVVVSNPNAEMSCALHLLTGLPENQIIGLSGSLDRSRLYQSIAHQLHVEHPAIRNVHVLGDHTPTMVPVLSQIKILPTDSNGKIIPHGGDPINFDHLIPDPNDGRRVEVVKATREGGARLTTWLGKSDYRGPAEATVRLMNFIIHSRWKGEQDLLPIYGTSYSPDLAEVLPVEKFPNLYNADGKIQPIWIDRPVRVNGTAKPQPIQALSETEQQQFALSVADCIQSQNTIPGLIDKVLNPARTVAK